MKHRVDVACLCAAWCDLCESYRAVFDEVTAALAGEMTATTLRRHWIDIEDESDMVGDYDVETFPTLLVFDATQVRFAGPVTPQPQALRRLLRATVIDAAATSGDWPAVPPAVSALVQRLRAID